jgi:PHD/YefM family antitoxin component YafN of YafNO toxin-antitoxin module
MSTSASRIKSIPFLDPNVEHVGVSKLRSFNSSNLGEIKKMLVIQDNDRPLAVMMSYQQYLLVQKKLQEALDALELLGREEKRNRLRRGLRDPAERRVAPLKKGTQK